MFKKNGGFTLVELIVVIAILAILAGITIPSYANYIEKAQNVEASLEANAASKNAQANEIWAEAGLTDGNFSVE